MQRKSRYNFSNSKTFEPFFAKIRESFLYSTPSEADQENITGIQDIHVQKKDGGWCHHPEYIIPYILLEVRIDAAPL